LCLSGELLEFQYGFIRGKKKFVGRTASKKLHLRVGLTLVRLEAEGGSTSGQHGSLSDSRSLEGLRNGASDVRPEGEHQDSGSDQRYGYE
jgi:hypothetical protein